MKANRYKTIDAQLRERAIQALEKAKAAERKKKPVPLRLGDKDNTILLVPRQMSIRQREMLKKKRLEQLNKRHAITDY